MFAGEITNWRVLDGPDREPFVFSGSVPTGEDYIFTKYLIGDAGYPKRDARFARVNEFVSAVAERDNSIRIVPARGVYTARERGDPTLTVIVDGERRSRYDERYPMTDQILLYTLGEPTPRERAILDRLTSPFGQRALIGRHFLPTEQPVGW